MMIADKNGGSNDCRKFWMSFMTLTDWKKL